MERTQHALHTASCAQVSRSTAVCFASSPSVWRRRISCNIFICFSSHALSLLLVLGSFVQKYSKSSNSMLALTTFLLLLHFFFFFFFFLSSSWVSLQLCCICHSRCLPSVPVASSQLSPSHASHQPPTTAMSGIDCSDPTSPDVRIYDTTVEGIYCPTYSSFFGVMGATSAMAFSGACQCENWRMGRERRNGGRGRGRERKRGKIKVKEGMSRGVG